MADSPNLVFPYLAEAQNLPEVTHNDALNVLDALSFLSVIDRDIAAQPNSPTNGDVYLLPASGLSGDDWPGNEGAVAFYYDGWLFRTPREGWTMWVKDEKQLFLYDGTNWKQLTNVDLADRREWYWQASSAAITIASVGTLTALTTESSGIPSSLVDATGNYISYGTGASTNADAGWRSDAFTYFRFDNKSIHTFILKTGSSLAMQRTWVGLFSADPMASDTPAVHYAAFRYAPATDGTAFWRCVTDNGSGTPTVTAATVEIATDTRYVMRIDMTDLTAIRYYINGTLVAVHTTTLPTATEQYGYVAEIRTLENVDKTIGMAKIHGSGL